MNKYKYLLLLAILCSSPITAMAQSGGTALLEMRYRVIRAQDRQLTAELTRIQMLKTPQERVVGYRQLLRMISQQVKSNKIAELPLISFLIRDLATSGGPETEIAMLVQDLKNNPHQNFAKGFIILSIADLLVKKGLALNATREALEQVLTVVTEMKLSKEKVVELESLIGQIFKKQGERAQARSWLEKVVTKSQDPEVYLELVDLYLQEGQESLAQRLLETSVEAIGDPVLYLKLGDLYERQGDTAKLKESLLASVVLFNDSERKKQTLEKLNQLYIKEQGSDAAVPALIEATKRRLLEKIALTDSKYEKGDAPAWQLPDLAGKKVDFAEFRGKVVVLDWWGSWCAPCRAELPHFQKLYESYRDKGVVFIGLNWEQPDDALDERVAKAKKVIQTGKYTFPVVIDAEKEVGDKYELEGFPSVYIIDQQGKFRYRNVGFGPGVPDIIETQIKSLLKAP